MRTVLLALAALAILAAPASGYVDTAQAAASAKPQCMDKIDNADPEDTLADANDPGCYTNGVYVKNDNDETDPVVQPPTPAECSNGANDDPESDILVDAADIGCSSASDTSEDDPADDPPGDGWTRCTSLQGEGELCSFTGTKEVAYGADTRWVVQTFTGGVTCSEGSFGSDPAVGYYKSCLTRDIVIQPPATGHLTGTHWPSDGEYQTIKNVGYGFGVTNVPPGQVAYATQKLDEAHAAGIKLVIGLYSFGGPEPYTTSCSPINCDPSGVRTFGLTQGAKDVINLLESRSADVLAFFGFNEPLYLDAFRGWSEQPCGGTSAAELRQFRNLIRSEWPGALIYHDLGHPSGWAPGGYLSGCTGTKYADMTGVCDYCGVYDYPFENGGYQKTRGLERLATESSFVANSMQPGKVAWLMQAHACCGSLTWPTDAQLLDWNCSVRAAAPAGALLSWYVWRGNYDDMLVNHPAQWPLTVAGACS